MKICVLSGSPRVGGNTESLCNIVCERLKEKGHEIKNFRLYDMEIEPCRGCRSCQEDHSIFGCVIKDDVQMIFDAAEDADLIIVSSPVYSWYCTPPVKAVLDRLVYGMNKYYGKIKGPSLWEGKHLALITTCGYPVIKGADLLTEGMKRYCKHSKLKYCGMLAERHMGYNTEFLDDEKVRNAEDFAEKLNNIIVER